MTQPLRVHSHRIIGSTIYDGLICLGLLMIGGFIAVGLHKFITGEDGLNSNIFYQLYLLTIIVAYFIYFWKRSGQTVGMRAWRIKLVNQSEQPFSYKQLFLRLATAVPAFSLLLIGVLWQYIDQQQLTWQDKTSKTKLVLLPKNPKTP